MKYVNASALHVRRCMDQRNLSLMCHRAPWKVAVVGNYRIAVDRQALDRMGFVGASFDDQRRSLRFWTTAELPFANTR